MGDESELRTDPLTGVQVQVTGSRQSRPNRPGTGCPFCVGGTEAPEPYDVKAFTNRWPSFPDDRCEVVLYAPQHDARLSQLPAANVRKVVDLWAERTAALGARPDIAYVLVFENNGAEVGATIAHPHGQIYAYPDVPPLPATGLARLADGHALLEDRPDLVVIERDGWRAWVPAAPVYPYGMRVAPLERRPDLPSLDDADRDAFASVLTEALARLEAVFDPPMPYLYWIHQRPTDGHQWPQAWLHTEIAGPQRAPGVLRYVAAAELGSGAYLNPVVPEEAAARLREVSP
ncbi:MAG: galT [Acidimicrobiales bacterium]|nr:galT [Acidimicrobiales bacterium]